jgi:Holliday junction DNA helicase RuvA
LHTHLHVRETEMELFGATDASSLQLFRQLLTVNGIGPKVALATLSTLNADQLRQAVLSEDVARITEVPGIGKKTAQRIILDLKSRLEADGISLAGPGGATLPSTSSSEDEEAIEALGSLGYTRGEARRALAGVDPGLGVEDRILAALRSLSN